MDKRPVDRSKAVRDKLLYVTTINAQGIVEEAGYVYYRKVDDFDYVESLTKNPEEALLLSGYEIEELRPKLQTKAWSMAPAVTISGNRKVQFVISHSV